MHTHCRVISDLAHLMQTFADFLQNIMHSDHDDAEYHTGDQWQIMNLLTVLWFLQDLHGVKRTDPCWLLPGASTGREAERPRVVWLIRVKQGHFFHFSFLRCHDVRSRKAVKTAFRNLAVLGKVSRSAEFGLVWAYSVGTAGAPKRADQEFRCKKSSKSATNLHKVCVLHT